MRLLFYKKNTMLYWRRPDTSDWDHKLIRSLWLSVPYVESFSHFFVTTSVVAPYWPLDRMRRPHLKANHVTTPREGCPNLKAPQMQPPNATFFSLFLKDAPLLSFVASHIPRFFARPKKKKERDKMATSCDVDHHISGPGHQKSWCKGKTSGDTTRKCSKD